MLISELAERVGLHPETIRRLERRGLIHSDRDINNWRRYDASIVLTIKKLYAKNDDQKKSEQAA